MRNIIYLLPNGPKNLSSLFPTINWDDIEEYYIQALDRGDSIIATSTINKMGCCCKEGEYIRIHFLNYLGTYDAMNFEHYNIIHEPESSSYEKSLRFPLSKTDTGIERFNVRSNETFQLKTSAYTEKDMDWLMELVDSPKAYIEWKGKEGQPDSYIPVIILNGKKEKQKLEERYSYEFIIEAKLSNEKIIIRN